LIYLLKVLIFHSFLYVYQRANLVELNRSASILDFLTDDGLDAGEATAGARSGPRASCKACAKRKAKRSETTMSCPVRCP
jgi:hypothetical protein